MGPSAQTEINIRLDAPKEYKEQTEKFVALYNLVGGDLGLESNRSTLKRKEDRICRFCGKKMPAVKFKKDAHLISELTGNRNLFSDFECDTCNGNFGQQFENDLAYFLGISRSLVGSKGKNGIPTFKCADKILEVRSAIVQGIEATIASRKDEFPNFFKKELKTGKTTFTYRKHSYIPNNVYKCILKWALSILPENELINYRKAIDFLNKKIIGNSGLLMSGYHLPFNINWSPHYFVYKKKNTQSKVHTHVIGFYFQNYILSFPIPFHENDLSFANQEVDIFLYPPLFTQLTDFRDMPIRPFQSDFTSTQKVTDDNEEVVVMLNPADLEKTAVYDSKADQYLNKEYNPADIKSFILLRGENKDIKNPKEFFEEVRNYFA